MLEVSPLTRPTAEQCVSHPWFSTDKEALQNGILINKNHKFIKTILISSWGSEEGLDAMR